MKRAYQSGFQKRDQKKKKEAASLKGSRQLTSWITKSSDTESHSKACELDKDIIDCNVQENPPLEGCSGVNPGIEASSSTSVKIVSHEVKESSSIGCSSKSDEVKLPLETSLECADQKFPNVITDPEVKQAIIASGPHQPSGSFPKDVKQNGRSFSDNYYTNVAKSGLKIHRYWLCYSADLDCVYCQPCWLFAQNKLNEGSQQNPSRWYTAGIRDWKHLTERIQTHEESRIHTNSCVVHEQWRKNDKLETRLQKNFLEEKTFWRKVLERILHVTMMLSTCNLAFRGTSDKIGDKSKGNFLSIIELLSIYDPILDKLLKLPEGCVKYLSPKIQNELINLLAKEVLRDIKSELKNAPFFSIILDTTQDVTKKDQLSETFRYVKVVHDDDGKPSELKICEVFTSFTEVRDQSARGLQKQILQSIKEKELDIRKCRGQSYDGAAVMSGIYSGLQKQILDIAPHAYFVHCAAHNLNLVLKDAVGSNRKIANFFEVVEDVYCFFGHSINRWNELQSTYDTEEPINTTLKRLNPTRWAGRYNAVHALKVRYQDIMKCLSRILLISKKPKERNEAEGLKKKLENFNFVLLLVIQCKILQIINIPSKSLQSENMDLFSADDLLQNALQSISEVRTKFEEFITEASEISNKWGLLSQFSCSRPRKIKRHFEELAEDERFSDPKQCFRVTVFIPLIDTLFSQLKSRFEGLHSIVEVYQVLQPTFLSTSTDGEICKSAETFASRFSEDLSPSFSSQLLSVKNTFEKKISNMSDVKQLANFLILENSSLTSSYPDVCTACFMFLTIPVTVAKAERSFSKLKLIKNYLRGSMAQDRLSGLALLSIENELAQRINFDKVIDEFAVIKARKKQFLKL